MLFYKAFSDKFPDRVIVKNILHFFDVFFDLFKVAEGYRAHLSKSAIELNISEGVHVRIYAILPYIWYEHADAFCLASMFLKITIMECLLGKNVVWICHPHIVLYNCLLDKREYIWNIICPCSFLVVIKCTGKFVARIQIVASAKCGIGRRDTWRLTVL